MSSFFWGFSFLIGGIALAIFFIGIPLYSRSPKNQPSTIWIIGLSFAMTTLGLAIFFLANDSYIQYKPPFFKSTAMILGPLFYTSQYLQPLFLRSTRKHLSDYQLALFVLPLMCQFSIAGVFSLYPQAFSEYASSNFGSLFSLHMAIGFFVIIAWLSYEATQKLKVESSYLLRIIQVISVILVLHTVIWLLFLIVDFQNQGEISNDIGGLMTLELNNRIIRMGAFCIFELLLSIYWFQTYSSRAIQEREQHDDMRRLMLEKDKLIRNLANSSTLIETGALAAGLAHELNQFLARIEINGDLALRRIRQSDSLGQDLEPSIQNILQANNAAAQLISSLKKLFINGNDESSLVDGNVLVRDTVSLYEKRLIHSKITIEMNLRATEKVFLWDSLFRQLVSNLISNAVDALETITKENKKIVIGTRINHDGHYEMTFSDNGPGISPDQQERIFDLFVSTMKSGNGIGLWLCRYIVERHHGFISCVNLPNGEGAAFTVSIPLHGLNACGLSVKPT